MTYDKGLFSDNQAVGTATTVESENRIDYGDDKGGRIGGAGSVRLQVQVTEKFVGPDSLTVHLQDSSDGSSWRTVVSSGAVPVAELEPGKVVLAVSVPDGTRRFHRVQYARAGSNATAGRVTAGYIPIP